MKIKKENLIVIDLTSEDLVALTKGYLKDSAQIKVDYEYSDICVIIQLADKSQYDYKT